MHGIDELLPRVDPRTRDALIALRDYQPEPGSTVDLTNSLIRELLEAAGLGGQGQSQPLIPLPDELSDTQRRIAELLATHEGAVRFGGLAIPDQPWKIRRWLDGNAGVLERVMTIGEHTEPLWRALLRAKAARKSERELVKSLDLPTADVLEVFTDAYFGAYNLSWPRESWVSTAAINGTLGEWARVTADRLLEGKHGSTTNIIKVPVILALVRAEIPIAERWEPLMFAHPDLVPLMEECFATLPDERRDAALVAAIRTAGFAPEQIRTAVAMLRRWPSAALTELIVSNADAAAGGPKHASLPKDRLKKMMKHFAERNPQVGRVWNAYLAGRPTPIVLVRISSTQLSVDDELEPIVVAQIETAGRSYDGQAMSAQERLSADPDDERSFNGRLELRKLREAKSGKAYDAYLVHPDTATVFTAGTTEEVACMIQGGVECKDEALRDALREALR